MRVIVFHNQDFCLASDIHPVTRRPEHVSKQHATCLVGVILQMVFQDGSFRGDPITSAFYCLGILFAYALAKAFAYRASHFQCFTLFDFK